MQYESKSKSKTIYRNNYYNNDDQNNFNHSNNNKVEA